MTNSDGSTTLCACTADDCTRTAEPGQRFCQPCIAAGCPERLTCEICGSVTDKHFDELCFK